jgi:hypothetical protein
VAHTVDSNLHAFMHEAVLVHPCADACLVEQVHRDLFDDAGAHPAENVFAGLSLQDDVIDAVFVQELAEQESRRAGSNNGDLSSHASS